MKEKKFIKSSPHLPVSNLSTRPYISAATREN